MKPSIVAKDLMVVRRDDEQVLRGLTFKLFPGTITGLIGPSGSGKTTLMRSIVGVQRIHAGELSVLGYEAGAGVLRSKIGYMAQFPAVYDDMTVWQNLAYFAVLTKVAKERIKEILALVHLEPQRHQLVGMLSGGQKARVSLAVALLDDPDVLVLDEPTVGLDPILRQELWQFFLEVAKQGKAVLVSSHVMDEAERCERLLLLRDGELLWSKEKAALLAEVRCKTVEQAFLAMIERKEK